MLNNMGETARLRGDYPAAVARYEEALAVAAAIGDRGGEMVWLSNLGGAHVGLGAYAAAEGHLREAIRQAAAVDAHHAFSETYRFLAEALLGQGRADEALVAAQQALALGLDTAQPEDIGGAWYALGRVAAAGPGPVGVGGTAYDAAACFAASLHICTATGMEGERARTLRAWAGYEQAHGDRARGAALWQEARATFTRLGMAGEVARMDGAPPA
jgi:tetratricopeptide (TPR) repeat protein